MRIISLVPSLTELLHHLGLDAEVVGITKFCVHPEAWFRNKERIGGTKNPHVDRIATLRPDLIIASREENRKEDIVPLMQQFSVLVTDIKNLDDAKDAILHIGKLVGRESRAAELAAQIGERFGALPRTGPAARVAYLIWKDPLMCAGGDTFIGDMIRRCGWHNLFEETPRYPQTDMDQLAALRPDHLLLSSEPYPFSEKHLREFSDALPGVQVHLVDGECFSWYGSRLLHAPTHFASLMARLRR